MTRFSDQPDASRRACSLEPSLPEDANRRSLADSTTHPSGTAPGSPKRTSARELPLATLASTLRTASDPLLAALSSLIQVSASATAVMVSSWQSGGEETVQA